jgi:predicted amidohydrolase
MPKRMRLAVAQTALREDPRNSDELRASGRDIRRLMREAQTSGARLIHFPEGATCSPNKLVMSVDGPETVGASDWDRFDWDVLHQELTATAALSRELKLWTVVGSVHQLSAPHRPHNSMYVISDQGSVVTRYDERLLSNTKISYMYTPGSSPVTFEVDGFHFGCSLGMEAHFPEIFREYEGLGVDCVLFSSTGVGTPRDTGIFATEAQGHAATNSYWVSYSVGALQSRFAPAGVISPGGDSRSRPRGPGGPGPQIRRSARWRGGGARVPCARFERHSLDRGRRNVPVAVDQGSDELARPHIDRVAQLPACRRLGDKRADTTWRIANLLVTPARSG